MEAFLSEPRSHHEYNDRSCLPGIVIFFCGELLFSCGEELLFYVCGVELFFMWRGVVFYVERSYFLCGEESVFMFRVVGVYVKRCRFLMWREVVFQVEKRWDGNMFSFFYVRSPSGTYIRI